VPVDEFDYSPPNAYGRSKVEAERIVRAEAVDRFTWTLVRPTTIWGPWWGDLYSAFFRTVRAGRYLHPRGVEVRKSFGFVDNAVDRLVRLTELPAAQVHRRLLYLSDDEPYPVRTWAEEIADAFGVRRPRQVPLWVLGALARGGDLAGRLGVADPPITSYRLRNMVTDTVFDMEPLVELCGPQRVPRREGVRRTVEWMERR
jgi:nucleoside-diphosphate-sugar epimerase